MKIDHLVAAVILLASLWVNRDLLRGWLRREAPRTLGPLWRPDRAPAERKDVDVLEVS